MKASEVNYLLALHSFFGTVTNGLHILIDKYDKYQGKDALGGKISHVKMSRDDIQRSDIVRIIVDMYDI